MKKILFSLLAICCIAVNSFAQPATAAPTPPARNATDVISIYSGAYSNRAGVDFNPFWGQSGHGSATTFTVSGDEMRYYPNMNYQGIDFAGSIDVSNMTHLHFDFWTPSGMGQATNFEMFLVTNGTTEQPVASAPTAGGWKSVDIPLTSYTVPILHNIIQFKMVATPFGGTNIYIDNMYFYKAANVPTISNFTITPKTNGSAPFMLTAPTSTNMGGAFTYTSSNPAVATVSGSTVTITGIGTSTILATQAAGGGFAQGTISTTLTVTAAVSAPTSGVTPSKPATNVRSFYSDAYTNRPVETWLTSWSSGALKDTIIAGNNMKRYSNLNFVGVEFHNPGPQFNATNADSFHVSIWTPNATKFRVKLVDFGANGITGPMGMPPANADDREAEIWFTSDPADAGLANKYGPAPTQGQWNNIAIPISFFTSNGMTTRTTLSQLIFSAVPVGSATVFVDNVYFSSILPNVLPVDFKSFEITKKENTAQLSWVVASEINVKAYEVEKSLDGKNFKSIATVNAVATEKYSFNDKDLANGINYYRIKATDKDGSVKYSTTRNIAHNSNGKLEYSIYPNPAKNELVIKNLTGNNTISIVDATGRIVMTRNNVNNGLATLNISTLQNGLYNVIVNNGIENKTLKLVVTK